MDQHVIYTLLPWSLIRAVVWKQKYHKRLLKSFCFDLQDSCEVIESKEREGWTDKWLFLEHDATHSSLPGAPLIVVRGQM